MAHGGREFDMDCIDMVDEDGLVQGTFEVGRCPHCTGIHIHLTSLDGEKQVEIIAPGDLARRMGELLVKHGRTH